MMAAAARARGRAGDRVAEEPRQLATSPLRRLMGPFYFTGVFWYRIHLFGVRTLPESLKHIVLFCFSTGFYVALIGVRRAIDANLDRILGARGSLRRWRDGWRLVHNFSWCLTERYEQFVPGFAFEHRIEGREHWEEVVASGRGFILATAHVGGWELGSTLPATRRDVAVHLVREPEMDGASQRFVESLLQGLGGQRYQTHFTRGELELGLELARAVQDGEIVAVTMDRPRRGGGVVEGELFGRRWLFPVGVPTLARVTQAPILPVFILRTGRHRYRVVFRPPIRVTKSRDRAGDHRGAVDAFGRELESILRMEPLQWFCFGVVPE